MLDRFATRLLRTPVTATARLLVRTGIGANGITLLGFVIGLAAAVAIATQAYLAGAALILLSRLCDALDGAVARLTSPQSAGGFLDIALDFLFYASVPLAFAIAHPTDNALAAAVLLTAFMGTASSFLAYAAFAAKRGIASLVWPDKSLYFLGGLTEATETIALFVAMCLWPHYFAPLAYGFAFAMYHHHGHAPLVGLEVVSMKPSRWFLLVGLAAAVLLFFALGLNRFFSLAYLQERHAEFAALYAQHPWQVRATYFGLYLAVAALSLPGAAILTLAGGAVFGFGWGLLLVSFASSLGATLSFWLARWLLRDWVQSRFAVQLAAINAGLQKEGALYLFGLRLIPVVPFFLINLSMGLTALRSWTFYWVSQLGMLVGTAVYVNAGLQLASLRSLADVASPALLASFALLGCLPLLMKTVWARVEQRRVYARWRKHKPKTFERNLVVIGAGAGGLVASYIAAAVRAKVTLVEAHKMGGDCLNYGCVPSKALIRTARLAQQLRTAPAYGLQTAAPVLDFKALMQRINQVIADIAPHDSVARYTALGVDVVQGYARITSPWTVEIALNGGGTQTLSTRSIVIAAGAQPVVPKLPGLEDVGYLTSDTLWAHLSTLQALPKRWVVLGGGPIGCELAQALARLGAEVTQVEMAARLLLREDDEVSALVQASLQADGVQVLTQHKALRCERQGEARLLVLQRPGSTDEVRVAFDTLLCAVGRSARLTGYGLEELGVDTARTVVTNEQLQTVYPNIYAAGDVAGPYQFTHVAAHQAWYATVNALFGSFRRFKVSYKAIPQATFTDPELARVGLNEREAMEKKVPYEVTRFDLAELDRAIADGTARGWVKVLTVPGKDRILGVTIVGAQAAELLAEYVLAMQHGLGLSKILGTVHSYPTLAEANKYAAGAWRRAHQPEALLRWAQRFHAWRRG